MVIGLADTNSDGYETQNMANGWRSAEPGHILSCHLDIVGMVDRS